MKFRFVLSVKEGKVEIGGNLYNKLEVKSALSDKGILIDNGNYLVFVTDVRKEEIEDIMKGIKNDFIRGLDDE